MAASENDSQVIEGELIVANRAGYARRPTLTTARGIRRELASVYLEFKRGDIDADNAKTSTFVLRTILESVRMDELEQRITALEENQ